MNYRINRSKALLGKMVRYSDFNNYVSCSRQAFRVSCLEQAYNHRDILK